jgi:rRNA maturation RNase YbeY
MGLISGDIYISIDRIKENSKIFNTKFTNELHRVIIHGTLHLLGFDDKSAKAKTLMTIKENYYLNKPFFK